MGEVISLDQLRRTRTPAPARAADRVEYYYDLSCPFAYLAAERVERSFPDVVWRPACALALDRGKLSDPLAVNRLRRAAEQRATQLRMPLVWPERPAAGLAAMRVAHFAAAEGGAGPFVLAASRLAFCGGFDLDDPEVLAEAAAAAGLPVDASLRATRDRTRDPEMVEAGRLLAHHGADRLPAIRVGRLLFAGEERLAEAAAASRACATSGALAQDPVA